GKRVRRGDTIYTVVGVLPAGFRLPNSSGGVYMPLVTAGRPRGSRYLQVFARLAPGATLTSARAELATIAAALTKAYPDTNADRAVRMTSWQEEVTKNLRSPLMLLLAAVCLGLIIASAHVANMAGAEGPGRGDRGD